MVFDTLRLPSVPDRPESVFFLFCAGTPDCPTDPHFQIFQGTPPGTQASRVFSIIPSRLPCRRDSSRLSPPSTARFIGLSGLLSTRLPTRDETLSPGPSPVLAVSLFSFAAVGGRLPLFYLVPRCLREIVPSLFYNPRPPKPFSCIFPLSKLVEYLFFSPFCRLSVPL